MDWKRLLSLNTNTPGLGAAIAAIYAAVQLIINLAQHKPGYGFDPQVIVAAAAAVYFIYTRVKVTPVADPRDGNGKPLVTAPPVAPIGRMSPVQPVDPAALPPQTPPTQAGRL